MTYFITDRIDKSGMLFSSDMQREDVLNFVAYVIQLNKQMSGNLIECRQLSDLLISMLDFSVLEDKMRFAQLNTSEKYELTYYDILENSKDKDIYFCIEIQQLNYVVSHNRELTAMSAKEWKSNREEIILYLQKRYS